MSDDGFIRSYKAVSDILNNLRELHAREYSLDHVDHLKNVQLKLINAVSQLQRSLAPELIRSPEYWDNCIKIQEESYISNLKKMCDDNAIVLDKKYRQMTFESISILDNRLNDRQSEVVEEQRITLRQIHERSIADGDFLTESILSSLKKFQRELLDDTASFLSSMVRFEAHRVLEDTCVSLERVRAEWRKERSELHARFLEDIQIERDNLEMQHTLDLNKETEYLIRRHEEIIQSRRQEAESSLEADIRQLDAMYSSERDRIKKQLANEHRKLVTELRTQAASDFLHEADSLECMWGALKRVSVLDKDIRILNNGFEEIPFSPVVSAPCRFVKSLIHDSEEILNQTPETAKLNQASNLQFNSENPPSPLDEHQEPPTALVQQQSTNNYSSNMNEILVPNIKICSQTLHVSPTPIAEYAKGLSVLARLQSISCLLDSSPVHHQQSNNSSKNIKNDGLNQHESLNIISSNQTNQAGNTSQETESFEINEMPNMLKMVITDAIQVFSTALSLSPPTNEFDDFNTNRDKQMKTDNNITDFNKNNTEPQFHSLHHLMDNKISEKSYFKGIKIREWIGKIIFDRLSSFKSNVSTHKQHVNSPVLEEKEDAILKITSTPEDQIYDSIINSSILEEIRLVRFLLLCNENEEDLNNGFKKKGSTSLTGSTIEQLSSTTSSTSTLRKYNNKSKLIAETDKFKRKRSSTGGRSSKDLEAVINLRKSRNLVSKRFNRNSSLRLKKNKLIKNRILSENLNDITAHILHEHDNDDNNLLSRSESFSSSSSIHSIIQDSSLVIHSDSSTENEDALKTDDSKNRQHIKIKSKQGINSCQSKPRRKTLKRKLRTTDEMDLLLERKRQIALLSKQLDLQSEFRSILPEFGSTIGLGESKRDLLKLNQKILLTTNQISKSKLKIAKEYLHHFTAQSNEFYSSKSKIQAARMALQYSCFLGDILTTAISNLRNSHSNSVPNSLTVDQKSLSDQESNSSTPPLKNLRCKSRKNHNKLNPRPQSSSSINSNRHSFETGKISNDDGVSNSESSEYSSISPSNGGMDASIRNRCRNSEKLFSISHTSGSNIIKTSKNRKRNPRDAIGSAGGESIYFSSSPSCSSNSKTDSYSSPAAASRDLSVIIQNMSKIQDIEYKKLALHRTNSNNETSPAEVITSSSSSSAISSYLDIPSVSNMNSGSLSQSKQKIRTGKIRNKKKMKISNSITTQKHVHDFKPIPSALKKTFSKSVSPSNDRVIQVTRHENSVVATWETSKIATHVHAVNERLQPPSPSSKLNSSSPPRRPLRPSLPRVSLPPQSTRSIPAASTEDLDESYAPRMFMPVVSTFQSHHARLDSGNASNSGKPSVSFASRTKKTLYMPKIQSATTKWSQYSPYNRAQYDSHSTLENPPMAILKMIQSNSAISNKSGWYMVPRSESNAAVVDIMNDSEDVNNCFNNSTELIIHNPLNTNLTNKKDEESSTAVKRKKILLSPSEAPELVPSSLVPVKIRFSSIASADPYNAKTSEASNILMSNNSKKQQHIAVGAHGIPLNLNLITRSSNASPTRSLYNLNGNAVINTSQHDVNIVTLPNLSASLLNAGSDGSAFDEQDASSSLLLQQLSSNQQTNVFNDDLVKSMSCDIPQSIEPAKLPYDEHELNSRTPVVVVTGSNSIQSTSKISTPLYDTSAHTNNSNIKISPSPSSSPPAPNNILNSIPTSSAVAGCPLSPASLSPHDLLPQSHISTHSQQTTIQHAFPFFNVTSPTISHMNGNFIGGSILAAQQRHSTGSDTFKLNASFHPVLISDSNIPSKTHLDNVVDKPGSHAQNLSFTAIPTSLPSSFPFSGDFVLDECGMPQLKNTQLIDNAVTRNSVSVSNGMSGFNSGAVISKTKTSNKLNSEEFLNHSPTSSSSKHMKTVSAANSFNKNHHGQLSSSPVHSARKPSSLKLQRSPSQQRDSSLTPHNIGDRAPDPSTPATFLRRRSRVSPVHNTVQFTTQSLSESPQTFADTQPSAATSIATCASPGLGDSIPLTTQGTISNQEASISSSSIHLLPNPSSSRDIYIANENDSGKLSRKHGAAWRPPPPHIRPGTAAPPPLSATANLSRRPSPSSVHQASSVKQPIPNPKATRKSPAVTSKRPLPSSTHAASSRKASPSNRLSPNRAGRAISSAALSSTSSMRSHYPHQRTSANTSTANGVNKNKLNQSLMKSAIPTSNISLVHSTESPPTVVRASADTNLNNASQSISPNLYKQKAQNLVIIPPGMSSEGSPPTTITNGVEFLLSLNPDKIIENNNEVLMNLDDKRSIRHLVSPVNKSSRSARLRSSSDCDSISNRSFSSGSGIGSVEGNLPRENSINFIFNDAYKAKLKTINYPTTSNDEVNNEESLGLLHKGYSTVDQLQLALDNSNILDNPNSVTDTSHSSNSLHKHNYHIQVESPFSLFNSSISIPCKIDEHNKHNNINNNFQNPILYPAAVTQQKNHHGLGDNQDPKLNFKSSVTGHSDISFIDESCLDPSYRSAVPPLIPRMLNENNYNGDIEGRLRSEAVNNTKENSVIPRQNYPSPSSSLRSKKTPEVRISEKNNVNNNSSDKVSKIDSNNSTINQLKKAAKEYEKQGISSDESSSCESNDTEGNIRIDQLAVKSHHRVHSSAGAYPFPISPSKTSVNNVMNSNALRNSASLNASDLVADLTPPPLKSSTSPASLFNPHDQKYPGMYNSSQLDISANNNKILSNSYPHVSLYSPNVQSPHSSIVQSVNMLLLLNNVNTSAANSASGGGYLSIGGNHVYNQNGNNNNNNLSYANNSYSFTANDAEADSDQSTDNNKGINAAGVELNSGISPPSSLATPSHGNGTSVAILKNNINAADTPSDTFVNNNNTFNNKINDIPSLAHNNTSHQNIRRGRRRMTQEELEANGLEDHSSSFQLQLQKPFNSSIPATGGNMSHILLSMFTDDDDEERRARGSNHASEVMSQSPLPSSQYLQLNTTFPASSVGNTYTITNTGFNDTTASNNLLNPSLLTTGIDEKENQFDLYFKSMDDKIQSNLNRKNSMSPTNARKVHLQVSGGSPVSSKSSRSSIGSQKEKKTIHHTSNKTLQTLNGGGLAIKSPPPLHSSIYKHCPQNQSAAAASSSQGVERSGIGMVVSDAYSISPTLLHQSTVHVDTATNTSCNQDLSRANVTFHTQSIHNSNSSNIKQLMNVSTLTPMSTSQSHHLPSIYPSVRFAASNSVHPFHPLSPSESLIDASQPTPLPLDLTSFSDPDVRPPSSSDLNSPPAVVMSSPVSPLSQAHSHSNSNNRHGNNGRVDFDDSSNYFNGSPSTMQPQQQQQQAFDINHTNQVSSFHADNSLSLPPRLNHHQSHAGIRSLLTDVMQNEAQSSLQQPRNKNLPTGLNNNAMVVTPVASSSSLTSLNQYLKQPTVKNNIKESHKPLNTTNSSFNINAIKPESSFSSHEDSNNNKTVSDEPTPISSKSKQPSKRESAKQIPTSAASKSAASKSSISSKSTSTLTGKKKNEKSKSKKSKLEDAGSKSASKNASGPELPLSASSTTKKSNGSQIRQLNGSGLSSSIQSGNVRFRAQNSELFSSTGKKKNPNWIKNARFDDSSGDEQNESSIRNETEKLNSLRENAKHQAEIVKAAISLMKKQSEDQNIIALQSISNLDNEDQMRQDNLMKSYSSNKHNNSSINGIDFLEDIDLLPANIDTVVDKSLPHSPISIPYNDDNQRGNTRQDNVINSNSPHLHIDAIQGSRSDFLIRNPFTPSKNSNLHNDPSPSKDLISGSYISSVSFPSDPVAFNSSPQTIFPVLPNSPLTAANSVKNISSPLFLIQPQLTSSASTNSYKNYNNINNNSFNNALSAKNQLDITDNLKSPTLIPINPVADSETKSKSILYPDAPESPQIKWDTLNIFPNNTTAFNNNSGFNNNNNHNHTLHHTDYNSTYSPECSPYLPSSNSNNAIFNGLPHAFSSEFFSSNGNQPVSPPVAKSMSLADQFKRRLSAPIPMLNQILPVTSPKMSSMTVTHRQMATPHINHSSGSAFGTYPVVVDSLERSSHVLQERDTLRARDFNLHSAAGVTSPTVSPLFPHPGTVTYPATPAALMSQRQSHRLVGKSTVEVSPSESSSTRQVRQLTCMTSNLATADLAASNLKFTPDAQSRPSRTQEQPFSQQLLRTFSAETNTLTSDLGFNSLNRGSVDKENCLNSSYNLTGILNITDATHSNKVFEKPSNERGGQIQYPLIGHILTDMNVAPHTEPINDMPLDANELNIHLSQPLLNNYQNSQQKQQQPNIFIYPDSRALMPFTSTSGNLPSVLHNNNSIFNTEANTNHIEFISSTSEEYSNGKNDTKQFNDIQRSLRPKDDEDLDYCIRQAHNFLVKSRNLLDSPVQFNSNNPSFMQTFENAQQQLNAPDIDGFIKKNNTSRNSTLAANLLSSTSDGSSHVLSPIRAATYIPIPPLIASNFDPSAPLVQMNGLTTVESAVTTANQLINHSSLPNNFLPDRRQFNSPTKVIFDGNKTDYLQPNLVRSSQNQMQNVQPSLKQSNITVMSKGAYDVPAGLVLPSQLSFSLRGNVKKD